MLTLACGCMKKDLVPYEGFSGKVKEGNTNPLDTSSNDVDTSSNDVDTSSNDVDASGNGDVDASGNGIGDASGNGIGDAKEGFATLGYANIDNISQIDTISTVNGSMNCLSQSSNLTNSMGPLCLSKEQQMALQTRGGNASCPPM